MTERFMMKNRPPREPGVCYSLGGRLADPNEKPQKRPFSLVERRKLEAGLSDNKDNVRTESYRTGRLIISKPGEKNPGEYTDRRRAGRITDEDEKVFLGRNR